MSFGCPHCGAQFDRSDNAAFHSYHCERSYPRLLIGALNGVQAVADYFWREALAAPMIADKLRNKIAEFYQLFGALAHETNTFDLPMIQTALDHLSNPDDFLDVELLPLDLGLHGAGSKLLPREPTEEMCRAYYAALHGTHPTATMNPDKALVEHHIKARKRWQAMWDAAK